MTESSANSDAADTTPHLGAHANVVQGAGHGAGVAWREDTATECSILERLEAFAAELRQIQASRLRR
jgi:hypothetical protein